MNYFNQNSGLTQEEIDEFIGVPEPVDEEAEYAQLMAELDAIGADKTKDAPVLGEEAGPIPVVPEETINPSFEQPETTPINTAEPTYQPKPVQSVGATPCAAPSQSIRIPDGYALFGDGVYELPLDETADPIFICSPLRVEATFADQHGKGWGRLINMKSPNEVWHEIPFTDAELLRPTDVVATLVDHGLELSGDKKTRDRLMNLLKSWKPSEHLQSVKQMGWFDDTHKAFVLGATVVGRSDVMIQTHTTGHFGGLVCRGGESDWQLQVGQKCKGNPLMILAVSLAFSGPLLAPLGLSGGGLHFRGASSSGKTTLLNLAASVWGSRQLIMQWRATSNGLEAKAANMNDMLLPLDEIAEISARDLHNAIYMLANGTGKARMTKDVTAADQARWRLAVISSGEISVEQKLAEARLGAMAGHEVRLIDIEADSRVYGAFDELHGESGAASFADSMQHATNDFYGTVGQAFVRRLIERATATRLDDLDRLVRDLVSSWLPKLPGATDGQVSRVAKRFALIGLAGAIATEFGLTGWNDQEAVEAAEEAFLDWYDRRYGSRREAAADFMVPLQGFLSANLNAMPTVGTSPAPGVDPVGWRDGAHVYLPPATWTQIFPSETGTAAAKAVLALQMLLPGEEGRHMRKSPRAIPGRPRLYTLITDRVMAYKAA